MVSVPYSRLGGLVQEASKLVLLGGSHPVGDTRHLSLEPMELHRPTNLCPRGVNAARAVRRDHQVQE